MKKLLLLFLILAASPFLYGQGSVTVTGTVTDATTGNPAVGISVSVVGGSTGMVTGNDGNYSISGLTPQSVLSFSFIGMKTQRITVGSRTVINVKMEEDVVSVDAVVVVGYGTQKAKDLTAPIAVVQGAELASLPSANAAQALQGQLAGVQVINSGAPGSGSTIKIRGVGSMGDNTAKPLYVVDNVFVDNIDFLSSNDIETLSVLKDASASAIYGVRAANGVVLVTTKKGSGRRAVISYDGYAGVQTPVNVMPMVTDKNKYVALINESNDWNNQYVPISPDIYPVSTDWYSKLLRNAFTQNHSLDVSGQNSSTNYSFGLNYFDQDGIMDTENNYNRINLRMRAEQQTNKWLKLGGNVMVSMYDKTSAEENALRQAYINAPVYPVYDADNVDAYPKPFASPQDYGFSNSYGNPVGVAYYNDNKTKGRKYLFSIFAEAEIIKNKLSFRTAYNQDYTSDMGKNYKPEFYIGPNQKEKYSQLTKTFTNTSMQIFDNTLTYTGQIDRHNFSVMLGQSTRMELMERLWGSAYKVPADTEKAKYLKLGSNSPETPRNTSDDGMSYNGVSFFTRGTYNFADKYLATFTLRADGSSKYQQKWGIFPSLGLGWVMTSEDFMKDQTLFDYLKVRASWGMLGNDNIPGNSSAITGAPGVGSSGVFGFNNLVDGVGAQTVYQNYLKWESVNEYDLGADFKMLQNRLSGEIDGYYRLTRNVVFPAPIAGGGKPELLANNGKVLNAGIELSLRWADWIGENFSYTAGMNFTTVHNEVMELKGKEYIVGGSYRSTMNATRTMVGLPIGAFYGYEVIGVYQSDRDAARDPVAQPLKAAGHLRYKDRDGNKIIDSNDMGYLGSPIPKIMGGLDLGGEWKNIDFGITIYGQLGNKIFNVKRTNRTTYPDGNYDMDYYENRWHGNGTSNEYPSAAAFNAESTQNFPSTFFVEDGSYLRLQNVQVGYTFTDIKYISKLRLYVSGQRIWTLFGYNGFSPEVSGSPTSTGMDNNVYPMQAIYTIGAKITF